jgi:hypothetical protein
MYLGSSSIVTALAVALLVVSALPTRALEPGPAEGTIYDAAARAVAKGWTHKTKMLGFGIVKTEFTEVPRDGAVLVGFDLGIGKFMNIDVIYAVRAVYRAANGEISVGEHGLFRTKDGSSKKEIKTKVTRTVRLRARPGYAVSGITVRSGLLINGLSATFMRIDGTSLDPQQSYESEWVGDRTGGSEHSVRGDGDPVIGIFGNKEADHIMALGLVTMQPLSTSGAAKAPPQKPRANPAAPPAAEAAPDPAANRPIEHVIDKHFDHENHFSLTVPQGWQRMGRKEMDMIRDFVRQRGMADMVRYEAGFRPNGSSMGSFPYILVQVFPVQTQGLTYQEIQDKLNMGIDEPLKVVEEKLPELVRDLTAGKPMLDKSHNRIVIRLSSDVAGVGKAEAISMCHLGKECVVGIHCYAKADGFDARLPAFMDINNSFFFDDGYEFVATKKSTSDASSGMIFLVIGALALGGVGAFVAIIGRGRMSPAVPDLRPEDTPPPMALPVDTPTGIQSWSPSQPPSAARQS